MNDRMGYLLRLVIVRVLYAEQSTNVLFKHTHTLFPLFLSLFTLDYLGSSLADSLVQVQKICIPQSNVHSPPLTISEQSVFLQPWLHASISPYFGQLSQV